MSYETYVLDTIFYSRYPESHVPFVVHESFVITLLNKKTREGKLIAKNIYDWYVKFLETHMF